MAVPVEHFSIIIPKTVLETKYQGGLKQYINNVPNASYIEDDYLTRVAFISNVAANNYCDKLISNGLHFDKNTNSSDDFVVVQMLLGESWNTNWMQQTDDGHYVTYIRESK